MSRFSIRLVIVLATVSVLGLLILQLLFLKNTSELNQEQQHKATILALQSVVDKLIDYDEFLEEQDFEPTIERKGKDCYMVNIGQAVEVSTLEHFLAKAFRHFKIYQDFEYELHSSSWDSSVRRFYYSLPQDSTFVASKGSISLPKDLPTSDVHENYFVVYFPERLTLIESRVQNWYLADVFMIIVLVFFGYTIYVIFKQRQLSEIQKNFVNNLTHEFKTPISAIKLSARVLENPGVFEHPDRVQRYVTIINEQTQRLTQQVERILQIASLDKADIQLSFEKVELNSFVKSAVDEFKNGQTEQDVEIVFSECNSKYMVELDSLHVSNVLFNIFDNAIKYCEEKAKIEVRIEKEARTLQLAIADNGIGISEEYKKKVFGRFFRVPTGDVHNVKGFGLGLDYVRKMIKFHRWKIKVIDNKPKGTQFVISINKYDEF